MSDLAWQSKGMVSGSPFTGPPPGSELNKVPEQLVNEMLRPANVLKRYRETRKSEGTDEANGGGVIPEDTKSRGDSKEG